MTNITPKEVAKLLHNVEVDEGYSGICELHTEALPMAVLIIKQDAEIKHLRDALEFYAHGDWSVNFEVRQNLYTCGYVIKDEGKKAKQVLAKEGI
jgi:hypothetical protein